MTAPSVDLSPDPNLDRVGRIAAQLGERIRDEDPRQMYEELVALCARQPAKAAQLIMTFAIWFDPDEDNDELVARARRITRTHPLLRSA